MHAPLRVRLAFTSLCVLAAAIFNGSIFIFPLLSPSLALRLNVDQIDLTGVALAGLMGQYVFAVVVGIVMDQLGTWACSLSAAVLYVAAYGGMEFVLLAYSSDVPAPPAAIRWLVFLNFLAGLATVSSYFGFLFASSRNFPSASGLATGLPLSIFGLSPLLLSVIASTFFLDSSTGLLDSSRFLLFLAILLGLVNIVGSFGLRVWARDEDPGKGPTAPVVAEDAISESPEVADENTPLVPADQGSDGDQHQSLRQLFSDTHFWAFLVIIMITTGACEMVMANIGTIVQALMPDSLLSLVTEFRTGFTSLGLPSTSLSVRKLHVQLISALNTFSRIGSGILADHITASTRPGARGLSRLIFVTLASVILALAFAWTALGLRSEKSLWVLSTAVGAGYGTVFTISPTVTASVWGTHNLGRNWGIASYAPLVGTPIFTFLYTAVSKRVGGGRSCEGTLCFSATFATCSIMCLVAAGVSFVLTRRWRSVL